MRPTHRINVYESDLTVSVTESAEGIGPECVCGWLDLHFGPDIEVTIFTSDDDGETSAEAVKNVLAKLIDQCYEQLNLVEELEREQKCGKSEG